MYVQSLIKFNTLRRSGQSRKIDFTLLSVVHYFLFTSLLTVDEGGISAYQSGLTGPPAFRELEPPLVIDPFPNREHAGATKE